MRAYAVLVVACATACGTTADSAGAAGGRWETRAPVPEPRTEVSVAADDSLVYLVGGFGPGPRRRAAAPRAMLTYDPEADRWDEAGEIPEA